MYSISDFVSFSKFLMTKVLLKLLSERIRCEVYIIIITVEMYGTPNATKFKCNINIGTNCFPQNFPENVPLYVAEIFPYDSLSMLLLLFHYRMILYKQKFFLYFTAQVNTYCTKQESKSKPRQDSTDIIIIMDPSLKQKVLYSLDYAH